PAKLPEKNRAQLVGKGQQLGVKRERYVVKEANLLRATRQKATRSDIPQTHHLLRTARGKTFAVGGDRDGLDEKQAFYCAEASDDPPTRNFRQAHPRAET